tara:strand:+ start:568 stop:1536 length:969 start_codon:yes stop_codon:yes gene_type:complete
MLTGVYKTLVLSFMALIVVNGLEPLWLMFVLLGLSGIGHSFEIPCVQAMVTGSVPREVRMNAVAVQSTGMRAVGALGALVTGLAIDELGVPVTLITSGVVFLIAGFLALIVNRGLQVEVALQTKSIVRDVLDGIQLMSQLPLVRMILITAVLVEVFGFAYGALLPAVAREALEVDVKGLGTLTMMSGVGSVVGSVFLMALGNFSKKGLLLIGIAVSYGVFVSTFSASGSYAVALILILGVGASAAAFDAMQWTLLQLNVPDEMRGRAVGAWVFAIGFGWVGHIGLGVIAETVGVQWALGVAGCSVIVTAMTAIIFSEKLRRA